MYIYNFPQVTQGSVGWLLGWMTIRRWARKTCFSSVIVALIVLTVVHEDEKAVVRGLKEIDEGALLEEREHWLSTYVARQKEQEASMICELA